MATAEWKTLLSYVRPEVDRCPKAQILNEIRRASITFFERSKVWQETLDQLYFPAGIDTAEVDPPRDTRVCQIVSLKRVDGTEVKAGSGFTASSEVIVLGHAPLEPVFMIPIAALKPTLSAQGVPEHLMEDWGLDIAYGAIASLKAMRGREWEDIPGAQIKNGLFNDGIYQAQRVAINGREKKAMRAKTKMGI